MNHKSWAYFKKNQWKVFLKIDPDYNLALICDLSQLSSFIRLEMARENAWEGPFAPMKKMFLEKNCNNLAIDY